MHGSMESCKGICEKGRCKGKALLALVLGVLFLLGTFGVWPEFTFVKYWPVFLVLGGLHGLFCPCHSCCSDGKMAGKDGECCQK